jgi:hypothetical protein
VHFCSSSRAWAFLPEGGDGRSGIPCGARDGVAAAVVGGLPLLGPFNGEPLWIFIPLVLFAGAVILGPIVLGHDRRWGEALAEAAEAGSITERLRSYLDRRALLRRYGPDIAFVGLLVVLMVLKPF